MEQQRYLEGLKRALKQHGMTYLELAARLGMSESGVKKMLNAKDLSFGRVLQICEVLSIKPGQLFSAAEEGGVQVVRLTKRQEDALLSSRRLLLVYWRLTVERMTVEQISRAHSIEPKELDRLLRRLVALDLLVERKGKVTSQLNGRFRWSEDSRLVQSLNSEWSDLTLKRALRSSTSSRQHRLIALKLSRASYERLLDELSDLFHRAVQLAERDAARVRPRDLNDMTAVFAVSGKGVFDSV